MEYGMFDTPAKIAIFGYIFHIIAGQSIKCGFLVWEIEGVWGARGLDKKRQRIEANIDAPISLQKFERWFHAVSPKAVAPVNTNKVEVIFV
jgi:hypothetical protein